MAFTSRTLNAFQEKFGLIKGERYDVFAQSGEESLDALDEESVTLIRDEKNDTAKRAMIAWASAEFARRAHAAHYQRQDDDDLSNDDELSDKPSAGFDRHEYLYDTESHLSTIYQELSQIQAEVKRNEQPLTIEQVKALASSGQSMDNAGSFQRLLNGYKKHGHKVPEAILRGEHGENVVENLAVLMESLESRGIGQRAQMSGKRLPTLHANLNHLEEPGKGEALAKVIKLYSDNGLSLSDGEPNRLSSLMQKSTEELEAIYHALDILPHGSTNVVNSAAHRLFMNMDFETLEGVIREKSDVLAQRVNESELQEFTGTDKPINEESLKGKADNNTYSKGAIVAKAMHALQMINLGFNLTPAKLRTLIDKNPQHSLMVLDTLFRHGELDSANANSLLSLLGRTDVNDTLDLCKNLVSCINALSTNGVSFRFSDKFKRLTGLGAEGIKHAASLFEAAGDALDIRTTNALLDYLETNPAPSAESVQELSKAITTLVEKKIPLHSLQGVASAFKWENVLERLTQLPADRLEVVNAVLEAMGGEEKSSIKRMDMLLTAVSDPNFRMPDEAQLQAIASIIRDCEDQGAPLTKHNLLQHLLGPNGDKLIELYRGESLKSAEELEAIGELYDMIQKIPDQALRLAKMEVLKTAVDTARLSDDPSILGRVKHAFTDLLASLGLVDSKLRIRDAVAAVNTAADEEKVTAALQDPNARQNTKLFREHLQAHRPSAANQGRTAESEVDGARGPSLTHGDRDSDR